MESTHILSLDRSVFVKDAEQVKQRFSLKKAAFELDRSVFGISSSRDLVFCDQKYELFS